MTDPHIQPAPTEPKPVPDAAREAETNTVCLQCRRPFDPAWATPRRLKAKVCATCAMDNLERFLSEPESETPETDEAQRKCHQHPARCGEFIFPVARSLERRLTQQASELSALRVDHDRLCRAINDSSDNCEEAGCDTHGHTDKCETFSPAAMLKQQQAKLDFAIAQLAEMRAENDSIRKAADEVGEKVTGLALELDTALADRDAARKEVEQDKARAKLLAGWLDAAVKELRRIDTVRDGMPEVSHNLLHNLYAALRAAPERVIEEQNVQAEPQGGQETL